MGGVPILAVHIKQIRRGVYSKQRISKEGEDKTGWGAMGDFNSPLRSEETESRGRLLTSKLGSPWL